MATNRFFPPIISLVLVLALLFTGLTPAHAAPPSNDDFASATVVTEPLPFSDVTNTSEATTAVDDPDCFGNGPTVWYQFTPSQDMQIVASTAGSGYDTTLSVYTGSIGNLTQIACNDDSIGVQSQVLFSATANQTYFIMVGAFGSGAGGSLTFTVEQSIPFTADLFVNPVGSFDRAGNATIRGTVTCSKAGYVYLNVLLNQKVGRITIYGSFNTSFECNGVTAWEGVARGENGKFAGGQVNITVSGNATDPASGETFYLYTTTVGQLKKK